MNNTSISGGMSEIELLKSALKDILSANKKIELSMFKTRVNRIENTLKLLIEDMQNEESNK